jgi:periplasmic protein TonB
MKRYLIGIISTLILVSVVLVAQQAGSDSNGSGSSKPKTDASRPERVRVSEAVEKKLLLKRVAPGYPEEARQKNIQGKVEFKVVIDTGGSVKDVALISGPPELATPSIESVKQWKYKPYLLNGRAVEVETTVTLAFEWSSE